MFSSIFLSGESWNTPKGPGQPMSWGKESKLGLLHQLEFSQGTKMAREEEGTEQSQCHFVWPGSC